MARRKNTADCYEILVRIAKKQAEARRKQEEKAAQARSDAAPREDPGDATARRAEVPALERRPPSAGSHFAGARGTPPLLRAPRGAGRGAPERGWPFRQRDPLPASVDPGARQRETAYREQLPAETRRRPQRWIEHPSAQAGWVASPAPSEVRHYAAREECPPDPGRTPADAGRPIDSSPTGARVDTAPSAVSDPGSVVVELIEAREPFPGRSSSTRPPYPQDSQPSGYPVSDGSVGGDGSGSADGPEPFSGEPVDDFSGDGLPGDGKGRWKEPPENASGAVAPRHPAGGETADDGSTGEDDGSGRRKRRRRRRRTKKSRGGASQGEAASSGELQAPRESPQPPVGARAARSLEEPSAPRASSEPPATVAQAAGGSLDAVERSPVDSEALRRAHAAAVATGRGLARGGRRVARAGQLAGGTLLRGVGALRRLRASPGPAEAPIEESATIDSGALPSRSVELRLSTLVLGGLTLGIVFVLFGMWLRIEPQHDNLSQRVFDEREEQDAAGVLVAGVDRGEGRLQPATAEAVDGSGLRGTWNQRDRDPAERGRSLVEQPEFRAVEEHPQGVDRPVEDPTPLSGEGQGEPAPFDGATARDTSVVEITPDMRWLRVKAQMDKKECVELIEHLVLLRSELEEEKGCPPDSVACKGIEYATTGEGDGARYRVDIGPFESYGRASAALAELKDRTSRPPHVFKRRSDYFSGAYTLKRKS